MLAENTVLSEPQPHNIIYTGHSDSVQPEQSLRTELFAANAVVFEQQPHNIYAGHSNSVQAQESLETQLFAANAVYQSRASLIEIKANVASGTICAPY